MLPATAPELIDGERDPADRLFDGLRVVAIGRAEGELAAWPVGC